jgi:glycosyltransferase involved in cell wall biosynthesis
MSLRVLHLLPSASEAGAGLASAVAGLCHVQRQQGLSVKVQGGGQLPRLGRASRLVQLAENGAAEVVHSHGLWLDASRASRRLRRAGLPTVVAPHGMLDPWAWQRRRAIKQLLWWMGESNTVQRAGCLQALCRAEADAIRALGIRTPIALIPNGVELPDRHQPLPPPPWQAQVPKGAPVLLFLGRFHVKKGLVPLLQAWQRWATRPGSDPAAWLVLVGFGDQEALADQVTREAVPRCLVLGPVHGALKQSCLANASGFVLPSFSEGLPMAALEAMSWGLPCLLSSACNLPEAFEAGAALLAEPDVAELEQALQTWATLTPAAALALGTAAEQLVRRQFSWFQVAERSEQLYRWLREAGPTPDFVNF